MPNDPAAEKRDETPDDGDAAAADGEPSLAAKALDLLVFAPAGAVLNALEDVPGMAARGRSVLEQEVRNAHLIGQFAVQEGQRRLGRGLDLLRAQAVTAPPQASGASPKASGMPPVVADGPSQPPPVEEVVTAFEPRLPAPAPAAEAADAADAADAAEAADAPEAPAAPSSARTGDVPVKAEPPATAAVGSVLDEVTADLAIPGYATLSASQVVRRLDGLGPGELAAVFRYESATRGRRTILHRVQQLLGPGGATPPASGV